MQILIFDICLQYQVYYIPRILLTGGGSRAECTYLPMPPRPIALHGPQNYQAQLYLNLSIELTLIVAYRRDLVRRPELEKNPGSC